MAMSQRKSFAFRSVLCLFSIALPLVFGTACSSVQVDENDPASLYLEAEEEASNEHYQIALEKLRAIKNKFPYSKYAVDSQLKIADIYFLQESYAEAAGSYETFRDLHPKHEKAAYSSFRIAKSYFLDTPTNVSRDLTSAQRALDAYAEFLHRFPQDPNVPEAREDVKKLRELLAEKELYIGDFYFKRDYYESAKPRYEKVIELYSDTNAAKVAREKISQIESFGAKGEGSKDYGRSGGQSSGKSTED